MGVQPGVAHRRPARRMRSEMGDELLAMREPLVRVRDGIDLQREVRQLQRFPQAREHYDLLGVGRRGLESERLGVRPGGTAGSGLSAGARAEHRPARPQRAAGVVA